MKYSITVIYYRVCLIYSTKSTSVVSDVHVQILLNIFIALQLEFGLNQIPTLQSSNVLKKASSTGYVHNQYCIRMTEIAHCTPYVDQLQCI